MVVDKPYQDTQLTENTFQRTFKEDVDTEELVWHRDHNDRAVMPVSGTGWKLQLDNKLPIPLNINESIYVPKNVYHRLIKGRSTENLVVEITEYADGWGAKFD